MPEYYTARTWFDGPRLSRVLTRFRSRLRTDFPAVIYRFGYIVQGLYLTRVPILTLLILWILPTYAVNEWPQYLANLFVDLTALELYFTTLVTVLCCVSAIAIINAILVNGHERFGVPLGKLYGGPFHWLCLIIPIPMLRQIVRYTSVDSAIVTGLSVMGGLLTVLLIISWIRREEHEAAKAQREQDPTWEPRNLVYPFPLTSDEWELWDTVEGALYDARPKRNDSCRLTAIWDFLSVLTVPVSFVYRAGLWLLRKLIHVPETPLARIRRAFEAIKLHFPLDGYVYRQVGKDRSASPLYTAHTYLLKLTIALFVVWAALFAYPLITGKPPITPLVFLVVSLWIGCMMLAALAFFFDADRFPFVTIFVILTILSAESVDHQYETSITEVQPEVELQLSPAARLNAAGGRPIVVVAAAGGGIQAAAWTTRVLGALSDIPGFQESIAVVSGVSGGAVGALHFVDEYSLDSEPNFEKAFEHATMRSLPDIGWGLVGFDTPALFTCVPLYGPVRDRGWALERALSRRVHNQDAKLSEWERDVAQGIRPAVLFGATDVETGKPVVLGTTRMAGQPREQTEFVDFRTLKVRDPSRLAGAELICCADLKLVTAARLSATFPFVTPVSRSVLAGDTRLSHYMADGGYYDASGVAALIEWVDSALSASANIGGAENSSQFDLSGDPHVATPASRRENHASRILFLRIRPFPPDRPSCGEPATISQFAAPLKAASKVRLSAQRYRAERELELVALKWKQQHGVDVEVIDANYSQNGEPTPEIADSCCHRKGDTSVDSLSFEEPPLSWQLSHKQISAIDKIWRKVGPSVRRRVEDFLIGPDEPAAHGARTVDRLE